VVFKGKREEERGTYWRIYSYLFLTTRMKLGGKKKKKKKRGDLENGNAVYRCVIGKKRRGEKRGGWFFEITPP